MWWLVERPVDVCVLSLPVYADVYCSGWCEIELHEFFFHLAFCLVRKLEEERLQE